MMQAPLETRPVHESGKPTFSNFPGVSEQSKVGSTVSPALLHSPPDVDRTSTGRRPRIGKHTELYSSSTDKNSKIRTETQEEMSLVTRDEYAEGASVEGRG